MSSFHTPPPPPREPMAALIARSSLGTRDAARARARVRVEHAQQIVAAAARRPAVVRASRSAQGSAVTGRYTKPTGAARQPRTSAHEND